MRRLTWLASGLAVGLAVQAALNVRALRHLKDTGQQVTERVSLLLPARNEERHVEGVVSDLLAQRGLADFEVLVLDDGSTDSTPELLAKFEDPRLRVLDGGQSHPPPGWLGKPWACHRLSQAATGQVLVFVDADVRLEPGAIAAAVAELRERELDLVSAFPLEEAETWLERLVQPMLVWGWLTFMPLRAAEQLPYPSLGAANGQCIAVDAAAYREVGGHEAVRAQVIEDIWLARAFRRAGRKTQMIDGSQVTSCRMYQGSEELVAGYSKNVWAAFGGPLGSAAASLTLLGVYVLPACAALFSRRRAVRVAGTVGFAAGVANRAIVAKATGTRIWPDSLAMPASVVAISAINAISWWRHRRGTNTWKGRRVVTNLTER